MHLVACRHTYKLVPPAAHWLVGVSLVLNCRQYSPEKITENMECEIMHVVVEEARESYRHALRSSVPLIAVVDALAQTQCARCREEIVQVLPSNTVEEMDSNVERIIAWVKQVTGRL